MDILFHVLAIVIKTTLSIILGIILSGFTTRFSQYGSSVFYPSGNGWGDPVGFPLHYTSTSCTGEVCPAVITEMYILPLTLNLLIWIGVSFLVISLIQKQLLQK